MNDPKQRPRPKDEADRGASPADDDRARIPSEVEVDTGDGTGAIDDVDRAPEDGAGREAALEDAGRREAAGAILSPAMPPAGAGLMVDSDPRLDDRSETEKTLERGD
ncbi:MAG TPA: hypothetical protein PKA74_17180 [Bauldia sp.]|nr:hypothetical protein [Bauldia sp.]